MWVAGTHVGMSFWTGTQSTNGLLWQIGNSMSRTLDDMKMTALTVCCIYSCEQHKESTPEHAAQ